MLESTELFVRLRVKIYEPAGYEMNTRDLRGAPCYNKYTNRLALNIRDQPIRGLSGARGASRSFPELIRIRGLDVQVKNIGRQIL